MKGYKVAYLSNPNKPNKWFCFDKRAPKVPGRYKDFQSAWNQFLWEVNMGFGEPGIGIWFKEDLLAFSFEREGFPQGDGFDRMRVRVTGAMPIEFKQKLINELKSGKRHMRRF